MAITAGFLVKAVKNNLAQTRTSSGQRGPGGKGEGESGGRPPGHFYI